ncbi:hypothetical protein N7494_013164 [Penicillium frequentans]|uniref:Uncharacterized protein n=1 Tax=Penicillium frequentans TaxID=3151616 RepID=A0AAD6CHC5_9EURO|nr:hypothetical protein N7494_013164 [Penicillium glabrum]
MSKACSKDVGARWAPPRMLHRRGIIWKGISTSTMAQAGREGILLCSIWRGMLQTVMVYPGLHEGRGLWGGESGI